MSSLREGQRVIYMGDGINGRTLGERGQLLVRQGAKGNVRWADGSHTTEWLDDLEHISRIALTPLQDGLEDSLEVGVLHASTRTVYDAEGSTGALNHLGATGALTAFPAVAEDARAYVVARLRQDPGLLQATAQLDDDEREELYLLAAHALLRDAFSEVE